MVPAKHAALVTAASFELARIIEGDPRVRAAIPRRDHVKVSLVLGHDINVFPGDHIPECLNMDPMGLAVVALRAATERVAGIFDAEAAATKTQIWRLAR